MANERTLCCFQANPRESLGKLLEREDEVLFSSTITSPTAINVGKMQELTQEQIESFPTNDYLLLLVCPRSVLDRTRKVREQF